MITSIEIKQRAREFAVPTSTIERDYAQNWLLAALSPINMALKGGTGIRKVFFEDYRFSDDLDFTLLDEIDADTLREAVKDTVVHVRDESGILFEDEVSFRATKSGFKATTRFRILAKGSASPVKIDLDLTSPDQERVLLPVNMRPVFHPYSDGLVVSVTSYTLEEIMAEKIRSVFQRTRSRDLFDIWKLADVVNRQDVRSILRQKCEFKSVIADTATLIVKRNQFAALWRVSLAHQMSAIPDFDEAFNKVLEELEGYATA